MKTVLVTGGTVFVSKYTADYFVKKGYNVYVLNRNSKKTSRWCDFDSS
ncbi:NAD-dependent epimerase/dehydratase family protein [Streptococcus equinus]|nr:NAD-dependent epimerase/dehydratase family protein [Streptococcus equinus]